MITLMTLGYIVCVIVTFKVIKIRVSPATIATAALIGVLMLGAIVITWNLAAPTTGQMVVRRFVLQISPDVQEFVSEVHVKANQAVSKGDPLFDISQERFQHAVDQATAQLSAAKSKVSQLEAALAATEAADRESKAKTAAAKAAMETAQSLQDQDSGAISKLKYEEAQQGYAAALADDMVSEATLKQQQFALSAAKHAVDIANASLTAANFNLERCTYRSPVDGVVMNWQITEGTPVARYRFVSTGTIEDLTDTAIIAIFPQNLLINMKVGDNVEVAFKSRPGEVFTGKVDLMPNFTGEGQMLPSSKLPEAASIGSKGRLAVRVRLDDAVAARDLPMGAAGSVAVYTDFGRPFHVISRITIRIKAWMNYWPL